jgi:V8-like Glu-specific endopeptidase
MRRGTVVLVCCTATLVAGWGGAASSATTPGLEPTATPFDGLPQVGPLFAGSSDAGVHFCTAAVVHSPAHNLLVTAAHCVSGTGVGLFFAPKYHDGVAPYGMWRVEAAYADPRWLTGRDPRQDVAFLTVAPQRRHGRPVELEEVVGGDRLAVSGGFKDLATVVGYPVGRGGRPITCTNHVYDHLGYAGFDCGGYVGGTSGGPWITHLDRATRRGDIDGVIGGLHQGGCTPSISYSSYFDDATSAVYERAVRGGRGDTLPTLGGDGC